VADSGKNRVHFAHADEPEETGDEDGCARATASGRLVRDDAAAELRASIAVRAVSQTLHADVDA
jgi:hypothetical protein